MDVNVCITVTTDILYTPIVNGSCIGRDDIHKQPNRQSFIPKGEYLKQQRERRKQRGGQENTQIYSN